MYRMAVSWEFHTDVSAIWAAGHAWWALTSETELAMEAAWSFPAGRSGHLRLGSCGSTVYNRQIYKRIKIKDKTPGSQATQSILY